MNKESNNGKSDFASTGSGKETVRRGVGHGTLERRGDRWVGRWMWNGRRFSKSLGIFTGKNARAEAQAMLDELMLPYRAKEEEETLAHILARTKVAADRVAENNDKKPALRIDCAFEAYANHPQRPQRALKNGGQNMLNEYRARFRNFADWMKDNYPEIVELRGVSKEVVFEFLSMLGNRVSANTYNKHVTFFTSLWDVLNEKARLVGNPWKAVSKKPQPKSIRRGLTVEELGKIAQVAKGEMWLLFAIGVYTGLRLGDAVSLKWGAVDFTKNRVMVEPSKTERFTMGEPVPIPLVPQFRTILENVTHGKSSGYIVPGLAEMYMRDKAAVSKRVQKLFESCGINTQVKNENGEKARVEVGFHSLRHTFVSIAAESGIPMAIVQAIVGHSSPAMTQHYTHVSERALQSHISQFPSVYSLPNNNRLLSNPGWIDIEVADNVNGDVSGGCSVAGSGDGETCETVEFGGFAKDGFGGSVMQMIEALKGMGADEIRFIKSAISNLGDTEIEKTVNVMVSRVASREYHRAGWWLDEDIGEFLGKSVDFVRKSLMGAAIFGEGDLDLRQYMTLFEDSGVADFRDYGIVRSKSGGGWKNTIKVQRVWRRDLFILWFKNMLKNGVRIAWPKFT